MTNINSDTSKTNKDIILGILDKGVTRYTASLESCREAFSERSVHGLRVSIRRLTTIIRVVNKILPHDNVTSLLSFLKSQLKLFNPLRDTQVMMKKTEEIAASHPALGIFGSGLREREKNYILSLNNKIQQLSISRVEPAFMEINKYYNTLEISDSVVNAHIINAMNSSFTKVVELNNIAKIDDFGSLHKVRLAFKKFRYRAEAFSEIINYPASIRRELGKYQDLLGAIQDNSVLMKSIEEFSVNNKLEKEFAPALIEIRKKGDFLVNNYFSNSNRLFDFWALPQQPALLGANSNTNKPRH